MSGDLGRALDALREAHRLDASNAIVSSELALTLLLSDPYGYAKDANRLAREARRADPKLPLPYVVLGILMEQLRDLARAEQLYRYALVQDPECHEAQRRLDDVQQKTQRNGSK